MSDRSDGDATVPREPEGRVLVVDDDEAIRALLDELLEEEGYEVETVETGEEGLRVLERELFDAVLLDLNLPGMSGLNTLAAAPALQTDAQFIVMTAFGGVETAVEAMKRGAFDYLTKPVRPEELVVVLERALRQTELRREVAQLRRQSSRGVRSRIVGKSAPVERMFDLVERVAPTRSTVLVSGETGTGKELAARAIHDLSPRADGPFVPVNCSALPESLLESELFGHVKGSFTGATSDRRGLFEEASGGTLFLDEISTVSENIQVKLLRVLEERRIQRVGGNRPIPVDFRLIAATNRDLAERMEAGEFREDLFYRVHVFPLEVPPLRERSEDIPLLADHFRTRFAEQNDVDPPEIPPETMARMVDYDWPGNIRELENFVERAMIMYAGAPSIRFDLPARENGHEREMVEQAVDEGWDMDRLEREYLLSVLEATDGNRSAAAERMGIDRRTVYRKLKRYEEEGVPCP